MSELQTDEKTRCPIITKSGEQCARYITKTGLCSAHSPKSDGPRKPREPKEPRQPRVKKPKSESIRALRREAGGTEGNDIVFVADYLASIEYLGRKTEEILDCFKTRKGRPRVSTSQYGSLDAYLTETRKRVTTMISEARDMKLAVKKEWSHLWPMTDEEEEVE